MSTSIALKWGIILSVKPGCGITIDSLENMGESGSVDVMREHDAVVVNKRGGRGKRSGVKPAELPDAAIVTGTERVMDTGIRTDRIEKVREIVGGLLEQAPDDSLRASGYVHIFGVAEACVLLAIKRGEDIELAAAAGYLHDIASYTTGNTIDHAHRGAEMARSILRETGIFSEEEIEKVCLAIYFHSDKKLVHGPLEEILKDADVMQHCLFDPGYVAKKEKDRYKGLRKEFGLPKIRPASDTRS